MQKSVFRGIFPAVAALALLAGCKDATGPELGPVEVQLSLAAGEVFTGSAGTTTLSVDSGEYMLVPFFFSETGSATRTLTLRATNIEAAGGGASAGTGTFGGLVLEAPGDAAPHPDHHFHHRFRAREAGTLEPLMEDARRAVGQAGIRPMVSPATGGAPNVGDEMAFRLPWTTDEEDVNLCTIDDPEERTGIVAAVSDRAIVVADPRNPSNGYSSADFQDFARSFDEKIWPLGTRIFGRPTDLDQNDRIIIFFTSAVNELSDPSSGGFVAGLLFRGDLFRQRQNGSDLCPTSNEAELFHMAVPDPNGTVGVRLSRDFLRNSASATLAHEFQHLINTARRLYEAPTTDRLEEIWLDEALSHAAEEALFYQETDLGSRRNITVADLRESDERREAFNLFAVQNFSRLGAYLGNPSATSPFDPDATLAARGAIWQFLRYAADRRGDGDEELFGSLVNTSRRGTANLDAALGGRTEEWLQDWSVAAFTDDHVTGVDPRFAHPSWHYRDIFGELGRQSGDPPHPFPLRIQSLREGDQDLTLAAASAAYYRFTVVEGDTARVQITTGADERVRLSLVRIR